MAFWQNSLFRTTFVLMLAGLLGLAAIVAASLWLTARVETAGDEVVQERRIRTEAAAVLALVRDSETGQRGFLLTGEPGYLAPYENSAPRLPEALARLDALAGTTPRIADDVARVTALTRAKLEELARTIELQKAGRHDEALALMRRDEGRTTMDSIRTLLVAMVSASDRRVSALLEDGRAATNALFWVNSAASAWIVLLAGAAAWTVARHTRELSQARLAVVAANLTLEERVKERTADLGRANDEIQRFAYIVSHDLRAPLVNIVGFTSELETGVATLQRFVASASVSEEQAALADEARIAANDDLPEAVGFIRASTTKMDRLINAILKLSREGRRELRSEPVALNELIGAIAASLQHQLEQSGARIDIAAAMPMVMADRLALEQVFGNLIDNALKYRSPDRPAVIAVSAESAGGSVTVDVQDNGRGIAPQDHERVFELFRRAGAQNVPGEGIGLAHVRALVRRLGGDITVQSTLGRGSLFRVTIPRVYARRNDQERA